MLSTKPEIALMASFYDMVVLPQEFEGMVADNTERLAKAGAIDLKTADVTPTFHGVLPALDFTVTYTLDDVAFADKYSYIGHEKGFLLVISSTTGSAAKDVAILATVAEYHNHMVDSATAA